MILRVDNTKHSHEVSSLDLTYDIVDPSRTDIPGLTIKAILEFGDRTKEGQLVLTVAEPWRAVLKALQRDPSAIYSIDPYVFEAMIAGAYVEAGFDEVILTPRSRDKGRDIVATKNGVGSIRIIDQTKAYAPGNSVGLDDVRAMLGVLAASPSASKAVITTTSTFAPGVETDELIKPFIPTRLELRPKDVLLPWLSEVFKYGTGAK